MIEIALGSAAALITAPLLVAHRVLNQKVDSPTPCLPNHLMPIHRSTRLGGSKLAYDMIYSRPPHNKLVIFMHGNGGSSGMMRRFFEGASKTHSIMAIDAFSCGRSAKRKGYKLPTFIPEINAAIKEAISLGWNAKDITLCGYSLGGSAAIAAASVYELEAVIAIAPFADANDASKIMLKKARVPDFAISTILAYMNFNVGGMKALSPVCTMDGVDCPVHVLAGKKDSVSTFDNIKRLSKRHNNINLTAVNRSHIDILISPATKKFVAETLTSIVH